MFKNILMDGISWLFVILAFSVGLGGGAVRYNAEIDPYPQYTDGIRFNYLKWVADASFIKLQQATLGSPYYLNRVDRKVFVMDYLRNMKDVLQAEQQLEQIYANPAVENPEAASQELRTRLDALYAEQHRLAPFAESVLEEQLSTVLADAGLTVGGEPVPRPLYHVSPLPLALIVSPRDAIYQEKNISLLADLPVDEQSAIEERIFEEQNMSALVVRVGGIGIYPTMGMRSTNLPWIANTIAHEWTHNYLSLHPLGVNYMTSPELRTINETVASIVGTEIGQMIIERYYPEMAQANRPPVSLVSSVELLPNPDDAPFDFHAAMRETRVKVDELLAEGKIEEAEAYMEARRAIFWQNGYAIRKLNQAYFAFYGAYADTPGGAAGQDPVGPAVRKLREQSDSLAEFIETIRWVDSFEDLLALLDE